MIRQQVAGITPDLHKARDPEVTYDHAVIEVLVTGRALLDGTTSQHLHPASPPLVASSCDHGRLHATNQTIDTLLRMSATIDRRLKLWRLGHSPRQRRRGRQPPRPQVLRAQLDHPHRQTVRPAPTTRRTSNRRPGPRSVVAWAITATTPPPRPPSRSFMTTPTHSTTSTTNPRPHHWPTPIPSPSANTSRSSEPTPARTRPPPRTRRTQGHSQRQLSVTNQTHHAGISTWVNRHPRDDSCRWDWPGR